MSKKSVDIKVDDKELQEALSSLDSRNHRDAVRKALVKGANIAKKETKKNLKHILNPIRKKSKYKNGQDKADITKGILIGSKGKDPFKDGVSLHLMGDFRLKFFEMGTDERSTKKGYNRGVHKKTPFFKPALDSCEEQVFETIEKEIGNQIIKKANRKK